jgi:hypothetical protein
VTEKLTQAERIAIAADKIVADWPPLSEEGKVELGRVLDALRIEKQAAKPKTHLRRAA